MTFYLFIFNFSKQNILSVSKPDGSLSMFRSFHLKNSKYFRCTVWIFLCTMDCGLIFWYVLITLASCGRFGNFEICLKSSKVFEIKSTASQTSFYIFLLLAITLTNVSYFRLPATLDSITAGLEIRDQSNGKNNLITKTTVARLLATFLWSINLFRIVLFLLPSSF